MSNPLLSQQFRNMGGSHHRQQVSVALNAAHAAFTAQHTDPDGVKFKEACERFEQFLDLAVPMGEMEQNTLVQILQLAVAMHENAINNPALTRAQRTVHRRASCELTVICNKARDNNILRPELRWEMNGLSQRAEKAFAEDFSRCFFMDNWVEEDIYGPAAPSPVSAASYLPTPRASLHDINDARQVPQPVQSKSFHGSGNCAIPPSLPTFSYPPAPGASSHSANNTRQAPQPVPVKEKAHVMLSANLNCPAQVPPLGRAYSMPSVMQPTTNARTARALTAHYQGYGRGLAGIQE